MYFTVNTAFMHYFDSLTNASDVQVIQNWTMHEQISTISLQSFEFNSELLEAPKTLKEFVYQYKQKKEILDKCKDQNNKINNHSFFKNYIMNIFVFIAAILSMIVTAAIVYLVCKHAKLKALVTGIALQQ